MPTTPLQAFPGSTHHLNFSQHVKDFVNLNKLQKIVVLADIPISTKYLKRSMEWLQGLIDVRSKYPFGS